MTTAAGESATRGRPREFEVEVALGKMYVQFRRYGYHATSLAHLTEATGLHKGSLYAAFGDKHQMFLAVLRAACADGLDNLDADLTDTRSPLTGIRRWMRRQAACAADDEARRGCLVANTTLELLPEDREVGQVIADYQRAVVERLATAIDAARTRGEIASARKSVCIARFLLTVVEGMWQLARTTPDRRVLAPIVEAALDAL